jgi:tight adherence protein C
MLIPMLMALIAGAGILLIFFGLAGSRSVDPVQARLTQLGSMQARTLEEIELQQPFFERTVRPLAIRLSGLAQRITSPSKVSRTEQRLAMAGNPANLRTVDFLGMKVIVAAGVAIVAFFVPEFWLGRRIKKRRKAILLAVPDTLDLLTISVRAGLSFDGALSKVTEKTEGPLADEFRRVLAEVRVGRVRRDALRDVVTRTDVQALTNFIGAIIQAEQLGVPISKVLQIQSDQLRIERRQRAEEMAAKAPIKMLFPLVGCVFPSMFIVILGPAIILIMANFSSAP